MITASPPASAGLSGDENRGLKSTHTKTRSHEEMTGNGIGRIVVNCAVRVHNWLVFSLFRSVVEKACVSLCLRVKSTRSTNQELEPAEHPFCSMYQGVPGCWNDLSFPT